MNFNKKCLVLGGGGFLGMHLCESLLKENYAVASLSRTPCWNLNIAKELEWFIGDYHDEGSLRQAIANCDIVYHLISSTTPAQSNLNPIQDIQSNVEGTLQLLDIALAEKVEKIIFVSSGGTVYGKPKKLPIFEDAVTNPICSYGISKLTIEKYLHMYYVLYGLDYTVLRVANIFGERQPLNKGQGVVGVFMNKALKKEAVEIWGDGEIIRDYIYVKDVVSALINSIYYGSDEKIFNIGSGIGRSLNQLLVSLETVMKCNIQKKYRTGRKVDVPVNILGIDLAKKHLHWTPEADWILALDQTYRWMQNNLSNSNAGNISCLIR